jgi:tryptophan synthase alpha chain
LRFGISKFVERAKEAGVDGVLAVDLTVDEANEYRALMEKSHLAPIFLAAPTSTDARLKKVAAASQGFIYAVARTGVTGAKTDVRGDARQLVKRIKRFSKLPVAVGFGISNADDFQQVGKYADAAVIGSAIVKIIEEQGARGASPEATADAVGDFIRNVKKR